MADELDGATYKRWLEKFSKEKDLLYRDIESSTSNDFNENWREAEELLPHLTSLKHIYGIADPNQKQLLIKAVFKHNITYSEGRLEHLRKNRRSLLTL